MVVMDIKYLVNNNQDTLLGAIDYDGLDRKRSVQDEFIGNKRCKFSENEDDFSDFEASELSSYTRRSTITSVTSIDSSDNSSKIGDEYNENREYHADSCGIKSKLDVLQVLSDNCGKNLTLNKIQFKDPTLPQFSNFEDLPIDEQASIRQKMVNSIHNEYVNPLLDITGYKWIRKEVPSKGKGVKIFSVKYCCSQQKVASKRTPDRSRQLTHPLKQFDCESLYSIRYYWSTQTIEINYNHLCHSPYKRLPEKLKKFIIQRLDMKAVDLYNEILNEPDFRDIKHLIFFSKVQSFWSKERTKRKKESTKEAFKKFFMN
ncbi:uncharacterized protein PRCAT00001757001 [Priceomyces carsonii]|uniref:uncharacterized protein n=1 Tax=Priceomyces carsonii TaxID=28549 RepID=UPI002EDA4EFB|nr:unnamed protein product [Priceomyces carsonii]